MTTHLASAWDEIQIAAFWLGMWFTFWPHGRRPVDTGWRAWQHARSMKIAVALAAVLLLAGCTAAGTAGSYDPNEVVGSNVAPDEMPTSVEPAPSTFGTAFTYEDGLTVKVARPTAFTPSEYAPVDKSPFFVAFVITIVNKTGKTFDPSTFTAQLQSGDTEASQVFDVDNGFDGAPSTKLLVNRQSTFKIGFGVTTKTDLVLDVAPGFDYEDALFTN